MSNNSYSISEISNIITSLPDQFEQEPGVVTVTQNGQPVMTILPTSTLRSPSSFSGGGIISSTCIIGMSTVNQLLRV
jgi:hypothetical protein